MNIGVCGPYPYDVALPRCGALLDRGLGDWASGSPDLLLCRSIINNLILQAGD